MNIILDSYCHKPFYEQIAEQIKSDILSERLACGSPLPSIRALANDLKVSVITTKRVYELLEADGYIVTVPQRGSFVADISKAELTDALKREIAKRASELFEYARSFGVGKTECLEIIRKETLDDA